VQTYAQHTLLAYIGLRMFADHPAARRGLAGLHGAVELRALLAGRAPPLPARVAHRVPGPSHPWSPQNAYVQSLAELGLVAPALSSTLAVAALDRGGGRCAARRRLASALVWCITALGLLRRDRARRRHPVDALLLALSGCRGGGRAAGACAS